MQTVSKINNADKLIMFLCVSPEDIERCWGNYGEESYKILFFVKGGLSFQLNGEDISYGNKTIVFMRDTDRCSFGRDDERENAEHMECYAIFVDKESYNSTKRLLNCSRSFDAFETEAFPKWFEIDDMQSDKLIRELNDFNQSETVDGSEHLNYTKLIVAELYYALVIGGYRQMRRFADAPKWFNEYYDIISKPEVFTGKFEDMIELSGRTREHLSRVFHKVTGMMISEFVISKRINYACLLLRDRHISISEVVKESGFTNVGTFYTNFKKITGQSPERYRKSVLPN